MRLSGNPTESVGAGIEVIAGSLTLIVSDSEVGVWPLNRVGVAVEDDGFHVQVDGEEFVFTTREAEEFARAVGVLDAPVKKRGRAPKEAGSNGHKSQAANPQTAKSHTAKSQIAKSQTAKSQTASVPAQPAPRVKKVKKVEAAAPRYKPPKTKKVKPARSWNLPDIDFSSRRVQLAAAGLVLAGVMAIFAAPLLAFLIMAAGSVGLLVGTGSLIDPIMATRLPAEFTPTRLVLVSVVFIVTGLLVLSFV